MTRGELAGGLELGFKAGAVLLLAWVVRGGGRDVLTTHAEWRWPLALAVVGAAAAQLLPDAWFGAVDVSVPAWLGLGVLRRGVRGRAGGVRGEDEYDRGTASALLQFVGLAAFALAAAWGLHVASSTEVANRMLGLAVPLALAGMAVVEVGLAVARRARDGGPRVVGTGVGLAGVAVMTAGLAAAWPHPAAVLLVSVLAGAFLTRVAFRDGLPWVHAARCRRSPWRRWSRSTGWRGTGRPAARAWRRSRPPAGYTLDPDAGPVLAGFALVLAVASELLARRDIHAHAIAYAIGAAAAGVAGLFLVSVNGPERPVTAAADSRRGRAGVTRVERAVAVAGARPRRPVGGPGRVAVGFLRGIARPARSVGAGGRVGVAAVRRPVDRAEGRPHRRPRRCCGGPGGTWRSPRRSWRRR